MDTRHQNLADTETGRVLGFVRIHSFVGNPSEPGLPTDWQEFLAQGEDHRPLGKFRALDEARGAVEDALDSEGLPPSCLTAIPRQ